MIGAGQRGVEERQKSIARETLKRAFVMVNEVPQSIVEFAQDFHHLFWLGRLGERGEPA